MDTLENLIIICNSFKEKEYSVQEFKSRLETLLIPDEYENEFSKIIYESINRLEEITFTALDENFYKYGLEVANILMAEVKKRDGDVRGFL